MRVHSQASRCGAGRPCLGPVCRSLTLPQAGHTKTPCYHRNDQFTGRHQLRSPSAVRSASRRANFTVFAGIVNPNSLVLVTGATGGIGQLVVAKLLERGYRVRAVCRNKEKAKELFGSPDNLEVVIADGREAASLKKAVEGVNAVVSLTGTTAFPSKRWDGNNGPEQTDYVAVKNLIEATPKSIKRFVLNTSAGVERTGQLPYNILNLFGVLKWKGASEQLLRASGLPFTIVRPGRLTDGPYTSYDLNTLLQATSGSRQEVEMAASDRLNGQTSRIAAAEAIVQALGLESTEGKAYAITSKEGAGPGIDKQKWEQLFTSAK